jgi:hypothetical protein
VTVDNELETWKVQWRAESEPLPRLKKKVERQNLKGALGVLAICACFAFAVVEALRTRNSFWEGLAIGIAIASVVLGSFTWWVKRGAWKPAAKTTLGYAELLHKRAVAKSRTLRFAFHFLLVATILFAAFLAWNWKSFRVTRDAAVMAAMALEMLWFWRLRKRVQHEAGQLKQLIKDLTE